MLVDSGYGLHAPQTVALLRHALQGRPLDRLVNTHRHSDHMGGIDWNVVAAPGHDEHAVMFHSPREGILISGDALWENGFGVVFGAIMPPPLYRPEALRETRETLEHIATLDVETVIPGHGRPFNNIPAALDRAMSRIRSFEADPVRHARHAAKVMITFALMDRQRIALSGLESYAAGVPVLQTINQRFLHMTNRQLADYLVRDLQRAGAVKVDRGDLVPMAGN